MSTRNISAPPPAALQPGASTKTHFHCPLCGRLNADYRLAPTKNIACWSCAAAGLDGGDYLRALAEEVGANGGGALLEDPARYLAHLATGPPTVARREPLPTPAAIKGWCRGLGSAPEALRWLREERGLSREVIRRARLGYDGETESIVLPMYDGAGELVAAKRRRPEPGAQMMAWPGKGRAWPLCPQPPEEGPVLVVGGELDALAARSHGLPATSVTLGAGHWRDAWTDQLRGRRVVVCFDVGEEQAAARRVQQLRAAGVRARRLDLRKLGLRHKGADLSDYLNNGGSVKRLRRHLYPTQRRTA